MLPISLRPSDAVLDRDPNATVNDLMKEIASPLGSESNRRTRYGPEVTALLKRYRDAGRAGLWASEEWIQAMAADVAGGHRPIIVHA